MTVHVGLIGAGNISDTHARALREVPGAVVAAVHSPTRSHADGSPHSIEAAAYDTLDRFLDHRPLDMVVIGSPVRPARRSRDRGGAAGIARARRKTDRHHRDTHGRIDRGSAPGGGHARRDFPGSAEAGRAAVEIARRRRTPRRPDPRERSREMVPAAVVLCRARAGAEHGRSTAAAR